MPTISSRERVPVDLPASATSHTICWVGVCGFVTSLLFLDQTSAVWSGPQLAIILMLAYAVPIAILEIGTGRWRDSSRNRHERWQGPWRWNLRRAAAKLLVLWFMWALIGCVYAVLHHYRNYDYVPFFDSLGLALPYLTVASIIYVPCVDAIMKAPEDEYTATFRFLTRRGDDADARACGDLVRSWLVKLFFLPLMLTWLMQQATWFINQDLIGVVVALRLLLTDGDVAQHFPQIFEYLHRGLFLLDLVIAAVGYCLTIKIMGAHVRSTERTALGWAVALACYPPFNLALTNAYINYYGNDLFWQDWLAHSPSLLLAWGVAILVLEALYVWATIPFGLRFSNLTNRGIITQGPYRFTKHPAYIAKNLSWWLLAIPFVTNPSNGYGWSEAIRHSILLLAWNGIYFMRARTEERHLHSDPSYGAYARVMDRRSVFAWSGWLFPWLRYGNGRLFGTNRDS